MVHSNRSGWLIALHVCMPILLFATFVQADLISGLYVMDSIGARVVSRADTDEQVILHTRISTEIADPILVSVSNDNTRFRLTAVVRDIPAGTEGKQLALAIAGVAMPVGSSSDRRDDGSIAVSGTVVGLELAQKIASELEVEPALRTHPGHQLVVSVEPEKPSYQRGEAITLLLKIVNAGERPVHFMDGGSQRGARNNQFGFTAYSSHGRGPAVPDTGDPRHFGGLAGYVNLRPGEVFQKSIELAKWFDFVQPDVYQVTAMFDLRLYDESFASVLWDDVAVARVLVKIESDE